MDREILRLERLDKAGKWLTDELDQIAKDGPLTARQRNTVLRRLDDILASISRLARADRDSMIASCHILAQCGCIGRMETILLAGASREFVHTHRVRNADVYFENWHVLATWVRLAARQELSQLEQDGEWLLWLRCQWKHLLGRYNLAVLWVLGSAYRRGRAINPRGALDRLGRLF
jgi:hypothetical protein